MTVIRNQDATTTIIIAGANRAYQDDMKQIIRQLNPGADIIFMPASAPEPVADQPPPDDGRFARLSVRQRDVLSLIVEGRSNKDIARNLDISPSTVRVHVSAVLRVLGVNSRTAAAALAASTIAQHAIRIAAE